MPARVSYRGSCHHSCLALLQNHWCAFQWCGKYRKPSWGWCSFLLVRCRGMDRAYVDTALCDYVQVLDHLSLLFSNLTPSPALPSSLGGWGECWSQLIRVLRFQAISISILNYGGDSPRVSVTFPSYCNTSRKATQTL